MSENRRGDFFRLTLYIVIVSSELNHVTKFWRCQTQRLC